MYIVLKNTENIENEIKNNSTNTERINKLGCTEGIKKTKLKKRPSGYEPDARTFIVMKIY